jgi:hypothetical protein
MLRLMYPSGTRGLLSVLKTKNGTECLPGYSPISVRKRRRSDLKTTLAFSCASADHGEDRRAAPRARVAFGIVTSGKRPEIDSSLDALGIGADAVVVEQGTEQRAALRCSASGC